MPAEKADKYEIICRHKDSQPSNLNELFATYGCQSLETRVPIVDKGVARQVKNDINIESQRYDFLSLKSEAASNAVEGRIPRTRNRQLTLMPIGDNVLIAAGQERDRSPIDKVELDTELEGYMREAKEAKARKAKVTETKEKAREERRRAFRLPDLATLQLEEPNWDE